MRPRNVSIACYLLLILLVGLNITGQILIFRPYLDDSLTNDYSIDANDAYSYVLKACGIAYDRDFQKTFADGYRTPGYPLFIAFFHMVSDQPLKATRYAQVVLTSLMIPLSFFLLRRLLNSSAGGLLGACACALWPPFYFSCPLLYAESVSVFGVAVLVFVLSRMAKHNLVTVSICLAAVLASLVYVKPNHLLLILPLELFCWRLLKNRRLFAVQCAATVGLFVLLILPWSLFVSRHARMPVPLTAAQGMNLFFGTGVRPIQTEAAQKTIMHWFAKRAGVTDERVATQIEETAKQFPTLGEQNKYFQSQACKIWMARPCATSLYGVGKVLHTFGFSLRGMSDRILAAFAVVAVAAAVWLGRMRAHEPWRWFFWGATFVTAIQAFVFLPHMRFKTVLFDYPALVLIVLAAAEVVRRVKASTAKSPPFSSDGFAGT